MRASPHVLRARAIMTATLGPHVIGVGEVCGFDDDVPILRLTYGADYRELTIAESEATVIALWVAGVLTDESGPDVPPLPVEEFCRAPWREDYRWTRRAHDAANAASLAMAIAWAVRLVRLGLRKPDDAAREGAKRYAAPVADVLAGVSPPRAASEAGGGTS